MKLLIVNKDLRLTGVWWDSWLVNFASVCGSVLKALSTSQVQIGSTKSNFISWLFESQLPCAYRYCFGRLPSELINRQTFVLWYQSFKVHWDVIHDFQVELFSSIWIDHIWKSKSVLDSPRLGTFYWPLTDFSDRFGSLETSPRYIFLKVQA